MAVKIFQNDDLQIADLLRYVASMQTYIDAM